MAKDISDEVDLSQSLRVQFLSYVTSTTLSSVSTRNVSVAADGISTSTVKVTLVNSDGNFLPNKTVSLTSSRGSLLDSISTNSAVTDVNGEVNFKVKSLTLGMIGLTANIASEGVSLAQVGKVLFLPVAPQNDWQPRLATGTSPGDNSSSISQLQDLSGLGIYVGTLFNFAFSNSNGWAGDGSTLITSGATGPYRLVFNGTSDYVSFGTAINGLTNDMSAETWIRANQPSARGTVIFSNGDATAHGVTLRQSWDGRGSVELTLGNQSYAEKILSLSPIGYWRLGETSGTIAYDSSVNGYSGTYTAGYTQGASGSLSYDSDKATSFDGTTGSIAGINLPAPGASDWTEMAWIKTSSNSAGVIISNREIDTDVTLTLDVGWWAGSATGNGYVYFSNDGPMCENGAIGNFDLSDGQWHQIVGVRQTVAGVQNYYVYVDGNPTPQGTNNQMVGAGCLTRLTDDANPWHIGAHGRWNSNFNGSIDEVSVFFIRTYWCPNCRDLCVSK